MSDTRDVRTVNMVHYPLQDESDPRQLDIFLDELDQRSSLSNVVDSAAGSDDTLLLVEKLRQTATRPIYHEYIVTAPLARNTQEFGTWYVTNRLNVGNGGDPRVIGCCYTTINKSNSYARATDNRSSETIGQSTTATKTRSDGVYVGSFTNGTTSGVDYSYSTTTNDHVTYTITGVNRIVHRCYLNGTNGGYGALKIYSRGSAATITGITQANPGVVTTSAAHGYSNGAIVLIDGVAGMTEVNGRIFAVANVTSTTFELTDAVSAANVNTSGFTAYSSGGSSYPCTEISSGDYWVPLNSGTRLVHYRGNVSNGSPRGLTNGLMHIPLAGGLTSSTTYVVDIAVDSSNPSGGRLYQGGLLGYATIAFDAEGNHCIFEDTTAFTGDTDSCTNFPGAKLVRRIDSATAIDVVYLANSQCGIIDLECYDINGDAVTLDTTQIDMYAVSSTETRTTVVSNLPLSSYYLHITLSSSKNASSVAWRFLDLGAFGVNELIRGTPGEDTPNFQGMSKLPGNAAALGNNLMLGTGNIECAIRCRDPNGAGTGSFVLGTHGYETRPTDFSMTIDGSVVDYAGGAVGDTWTGREVVTEHTTEAGWPSGASISGITKANPAVVTTSSNHGFENGDVIIIQGVGGMLEVNGYSYTVANKTDTTFELSGTNSTSWTTYTSGGQAVYKWADCSYKRIWTALGYLCEFTITVTKETYVDVDYTFLFNCPNRDSGTQGIGGGFDKIAIKVGDFDTYSNYDDSVTVLSTIPKTFLFYNTEWATYGTQRSLSDRDRQEQALIQDRSDATLKCYIRRNINENSGTLYPVGKTYTQVNEWRCTHVSGLALAVGDY